MAMAMAWSVLRPPAPLPAPPGYSLPQCRTANVEEKMENGECRFMCVFMAPVFRAPSVADCQRRTGLAMTVDFK